MRFEDVEGTGKKEFAGVEGEVMADDLWIEPADAGMPEDGS